MGRLLALCSLPRTNPGDRKEYVRRNGPYKLGMVAGIEDKLPFGNIPRLLLAWVCTEAVRTQSRELVLGRSLYEFMRKLGMEDVGEHQSSGFSSVNQPHGCDCSATPTPKTTQIAFTSRACQRLSRPPLRCGPPGDTPGPLRHDWQVSAGAVRRPGPDSSETTRRGRLENTLRPDRPTQSASRRPPRRRRRPRSLPVRTAAVRRRHCGRRC